MIRQILLALSTLAVVTGLASAANAQSTKPSGSEPNSVTLSGQSLRQVEHRSINGDFQTFFSGTSQGGEYPTETNVGRLTKSPSTAPIGDGVEVIFDDTLDPGTPFSFPNSGYTNDSGQVRVLVR